MNKPELVEVFFRTGNDISHWELLDENGNVIWSEASPAFLIVDRLARQNNIYRNYIEKFQILSEHINKYFELFDRTYGPCIAFSLNKGYQIPCNQMVEIENKLADVLKASQEILKP